MATLHASRRQTQQTKQIGSRFLYRLSSMAEKYSSYLLGVEDEPIPNAQTVNLNFEVNKVGGKPDWCTDRAFPNPECPMCYKEMPLAVQIYAPLDESQNHRTLYIFGCFSVSCHGKPGSWACYRDELLADCKEPTNISTGPSSAAPNQSVWLEGADDWGDEENMEGENGNSSNNNDSGEQEAPISSSPEIEFLSLEEQQEDPNANAFGAVGLPLLEDAPSAELEIETKNEAVISVDTPLKPTVNLRSLFCSALPAVQLTRAEFTSFYVNVMEETLSLNDETEKRAKELWLEYKKRENCNWSASSSEKASGKCEGEDYENSLPSHGSELVHKFVNRVKANPQQLVRYNRKGSPLLLKKLTETVPSCKYCGSNLVFEMQLMPHLSQRLTLVEYPDITNPIEFSVVVVFTCSKSCWELSSLPRQEYAVVQSEIV